MYPRLLWLHTNVYVPLYALRYTFSFWLSVFELLFTLISLCFRGASRLCCSAAESERSTLSFTHPAMQGSRPCPRIG